MQRVTGGAAQPRDETRSALEMNRSNEFECGSSPAPISSHQPAATRPAPVTLSAASAYSEVALSAGCNTEPRRIREI
jgi:hypothetical protein